MSGLKLSLHINEITETNNFFSTSNENNRNIKKTKRYVNSKLHNRCKKIEIFLINI